MKTIKQIADELGVSKQKVYRYIVKNHITASSEVKQSKLYDDVAEKLIKQGFFKDEPHQRPRHEAHQNRINDVVCDTVSDAVFKLLRNELEQKNEQLREKDQQIEQLHKLIDQEQQLRMVTEQKLQLIEQQQDQEESGIVEDKKWWQFWK